MRKPITQDRSGETHVVDLESYMDELRVCIGRDHGARARENAELDQLDFDRSVGRVLVLVPTDAWDVSSAFWLGMFGPSVRRLRAAGFRARYEFRGGIRHEDVEAGIEDALLEEDPLAGSPTADPPRSPWG